MIYDREENKMSMKVDLENKVVIITGAAGGIGRGMALLFACNGASVVVNDLDEEKGVKVVAEIRSLGGKAEFIRADVSSMAQAQAMADQTLDQFGKIDILINNAGINIGMKERGPIHEFPDEMWQKIIKVDLDGVYYCSKAVLKSMTHNQYGKIINIGSIAGAVPLRNQCAFTAAKGGVIQLTKAMAIELAEYGINVNVILPGSINIPAMNTTGGMYADGRYQSIMSHIPMKRPGTPDDIGYGALYLASDAANYVTGSVLVIDGGWTCGFARDW
jgi:3-oxoacyl-[acyl-carrier protein] reductase